MSITLENEFFQLSVHPEKSSWSLSAGGEKHPALEGVRMAVHYRQGEARRRALDHWQLQDLSGPETFPSPHGPLRQVSLRFSPDPAGLVFHMLFALPVRHPLLLWKLAAANHGSQPVFLDRLELLRVGGRQAPFNNPKSAINNLQSNLAFFSNGWQSWSYTGVYAASDRARRTRLGFLREPTDVNAGTPRLTQPGRFTSEMFGVLGDRARRIALLVGFLSQRQHFGSLEAWIDSPPPALALWANGDGARLDPRARVDTDWACLQLLHVDSPDPLGPYLEAVAREHSLIPGDIHPEQSPNTSSTPPLPGEGPGERSPIPTGWCSWYQYSSSSYTGTITEEDIRSNLEALNRLRPGLPLQVFQIDDGFESQVGDWFSFAPTFPNGLAPLAREIRDKGLEPGLWLAPFIVHPRSRLASEHPDWLLRGRWNRPVNAGFLWNSFPTALDLTHPAALDYARQVLHTAVHEWGFPYIKLDFLYAAALPGRRRDPTFTRAQSLRLGLQALRQAAGEEAFLLGCGCPLGPAIGLVDGMRIGADVARRWVPAFQNIEFFFRPEPNLPAARNAIHNALTRAPLHRRWWVNDPDCLLLGQGAGVDGAEGRGPLQGGLPASLTLPEVQTLATAIALTGGSLLLSDDVGRLPPERLRLAEALLPVIGKAPRVPDWFDSSTPLRLRLDLENSTGRWHLLALFNWEDQCCSMALDLAEYHLDPHRSYHVREYWSSSLYLVTSGRLKFERVPAHGVVLVAVRAASPGSPQYLGGDLHISQGLEVSGWCGPVDRKGAPAGSAADPGEGSAGINLCLERPGRARGSIDLYLPRRPSHALLGDHSVLFQEIVKNCYRLPVSFDRSGSLKIVYET